MKKVLLTAFAVMASLSLYGQGSVTFGNDATALVKLDKADGSAIANATANTYCVGLWWAPVGSSTFTYIENSKTTLGPVGGRFTGGTKVIDTVAGGATVQLQVRGWETSAASFDASQAKGISSTFSYVTGNPNVTPAVIPATMMVQGFTGLTIVVPEPSTIALGLMGLAGLFLLRRRS